MTEPEKKTIEDLAREQSVEPFDWNKVIGRLDFMSDEEMESWVKALRMHRQGPWRVYSVNDRLPDKSGQFLAIVQDHHSRHWGIKYFDHRTESWCLWVGAMVTHWCELPPVPEPG